MNKTLKWLKKLISKSIFKNRNASKDQEKELNIQGVKLDGDFFPFAHDERNHPTKKSQEIREYI